MEEARKKRLRKKRQRGQALVEYILVLLMAFLFIRIVFFNQEFGFKGQMQKLIYRVGAFLEQNLKSGARVGQNGQGTLDAFAGTSQWQN